MSDLVVSVRQISNYPQLTSSDGTEAVLVQQDGLGGPYATLSTADLVATALGRASMGIGTVVPADASAGNLLANPLVLPLPQASILWNAYDAGGLRYVTAGVAAALNFDAASGFDFVLAPFGNPGAAVIGAHSILQLTLAGNLSLPFGTLSVARDPASAGEVATLNYVSNHTVASFNARNGQVQLNASDVYAALCLTDPLATQPWVTNAINQSIQNLLITCPFVNRWNNRTGSVYLMLADIECVFYQSGQIPMSPTPIAGSSDDSIATTKWVQSVYAPATTNTAPPLDPTSGQLWWNTTDGNLYVYYQDPTSAQWVSAMADGGGGGTGAYLPLSGGTISPGPLTVKNSATNAPGVSITPIGMYDPLPNVSQSLLDANINMGQGHGGPYFNPTFAGRFTNSIYGSIDQSAVGLLGEVAFAGLGGVGQHTAIQAYANRYNIIAQPTTTVAVTLGSPFTTIQVADVSAFQFDAQPIVINGTGYMQIGHSGTSGPGSITLDRNVPVSDATAGNVVTGNNNPQLWGLNINVNDDPNNHGYTSSKQVNVMLGIELDFTASGLDDAGPPLFGSPGGIRAMQTMIGGGGTSGNPAEIADGILFGEGGGSHISWKRCFRVGNAAFSQSAFDTRLARQGTGANAVWLGTGHSIAFDTGGVTKVSGDGTHVTFAGGQVNVGGGGALDNPLIVSSSPSNMCGVFYQGSRFWNEGVQPGGNYIIQDLTAAQIRLTIDSSGNITPGGPLTTATVNGIVTINGGAQWDPLIVNTTSGNPCMIALQSAGNNAWWVGAWGAGGYQIRDNTAGVVALTCPEGGASVTVGGFLTVGGGAATVNSGTGAPTTTRPVGSLYMRTDGAVGSHLYVSAGGGTWNAVAGA